MHKVTSTQFRVLYASLKEPTQVTVNGHVIGTWMPAAMDVAREEVKVPVIETRTFTPAPKPSRR